VCGVYAPGLHTTARAHVFFFRAAQQQSTLSHEGFIQQFGNFTALLRRTEDLRRQRWIAVAGTEKEDVDAAGGSSREQRAHEVQGGSVRIDEGRRRRTRVFTDTGPVLFRTRT